MIMKNISIRKINKQMLYWRKILFMSLSLFIMCAVCVCVLNYVFNVYVSVCLCKL